MSQLEEHFSEEAIIQRLCKIRIRDAAARHKRLFHRQISSDVPMPDPSEMADFFPPRRQWNRFRNNHRNTSSDENQNLIALTRATLRLRTESPGVNWVARLNERIRAIQQRALEAAEFTFQPPRIRAEEKAPSSNEYRAIAQFPVDDQVIEGITAAYLRQIFDRFFTDSSLAFRCVRNGSPPPTHHDAVTRIENYRRRHLKTGLYVAECDIKGFFDCVSHTVAAEALTDLIKEALRRDRGVEVHSRALRIFQAYLDCYSFPQNVKSIAEPVLKNTRGVEAYYKWPEDDLRPFYPDPRLARIGIPQGGAISCFIANCVLHHADVQLKRCRSRTPGPFRYLRYCDDMVILAPSQETCRIAFEVYQRALQECQLPIHPPAPIQTYNAEFWGGKSRQPYLWARPRDRSTVPWLQFVGYQIRYDGMLRVKRKSIEKHKAKILEETRRIFQTLTPAQRALSPEQSFAPGIRKNSQQIIHRFRQKLIAMSVGRRDLHHDLRRAMPRCWASGFKKVHGRSTPLNALRELDRFRERQIARIRAKLRNFAAPAGSGVTSDRIRPPGFYGFPFSYVAQFAPTGRSRPARRPQQRP